MAVSRKPVEIVFGGQTLAIRPLTVAQIEAIEDALAEPMRDVARGRRIIAAGLSRDHAGRSIEDAESDVVEISRAMTAILRQGGFLPAEPGEAEAAAPDASTGDPSEAA